MRRLLPLLRAGEHRAAEGVDALDDRLELGALIAAHDEERVLEGAVPPAAAVGALRAAHACAFGRSSLIALCIVSLFFESRETGPFWFLFFQNKRHALSLQGHRVG